MSEEQQLPAALWTPREVPGMTNLLPMHVVGRQTEQVVSDQNVEIDDMVLPELKLCQSTSEEVQQGMAQLGQYVLNTTKEVFTPPLRVLIIFHSKGRSLFPNPGKGTGHLETCLSNDFVQGTRYGACVDCVHKDWPTQEERQRNPALTSPACSEQHNFVVLLPQGPAVVRFGRTSYKAGKRFITNFKFSRENLWANVAVLRVQKLSKKIGGRDAQYAVHDIIWDPMDQVPEAHRKNALEAFGLLNSLHQQRKLSIAGDDEE